MNRRDLLTAMGLSTAALAIGGARTLVSAATTATHTSGPQIFDPRAFGAVGDGKALDSTAINHAIDVATGAGGGLVYLSPGVYRCGTVVLKSNVTLYLEAGATLLGSTDIDDYISERGPPADGDANQKHLIFARDAVNVILAGPGKIDGQGETYWLKTGWELPADDWGAVATHQYTFRPRPSPMLEFYRVTNLRIEDVQIENAAGWTLRPMACSNVFIRGITIRNVIYGINCDGIDLTCCTDVSISDCHIVTADDAICLKSEDMYGNDVGVSRNISITNCYLSSCCNGLKFGTRTCGGFENITMSNCVIANEDVPVPQRVIAGVAIEMVDGGYIDGVMIQNIRMQRVRAPIFVHLGDRHPPATTAPTADVGKGRSFIRGITIDGIHATGALMTSSVTGMPNNPLEDITIRNTHIDTDEASRYPEPTAEANNRLVPEMPGKTYPEARMFGRLPAHGLYARHVRGLKLQGLSFNAAAPEQRPAFVAETVEHLSISSLTASPMEGGGPLVRLIDSRHVTLHGAVAARGTKSLLKVEGPNTARISVVACDAVDATVLIEVAGGASRTEIRAAGNVMSK